MGEEFRYDETSFPALSEVKDMGFHFQILRHQRWQNVAERLVQKEEQRHKAVSDQTRTPAELGVGGKWKCFHF